MRSILLILLFIFFLLAENVLLPALIGPGPIFITPLFLMGMLVYGRNLKHQFLKISFFLLLSVIFSGGDILITVSAFLITIAIYLLADYFLDIKSELSETFSISSITRGSFLIFLTGLLYSLIFMLFKLDLNLGESLNEWFVLLQSSGLSIIIWSIFLSVLFMYVFNKK